MQSPRIQRIRQRVPSDCWTFKSIEAAISILEVASRITLGIALDAYLWLS